MRQAEPTAGNLTLLVICISVLTFCLSQALLRIYIMDWSKGIGELQPLLMHAEQCIHRIRSTHAGTIPADSPVHLAIDPHIARRLPNYMPMRVSELPPQNQTWDLLEAYVSYWGEVGTLMRSPSVLQWQVRVPRSKPEHTMSPLTGCRHRQDRAQ